MTTQERLRRKDLADKLKERRLEINQKALEGWTQYELAKHFGITRDTVRRDLDAGKEYLINAMGEELRLFFYKLIAKSQHLEKLSYQQFYASLKQKQRKKTKVRGAKPAGSDTPEKMQVVETVLDSEQMLTGDPKFLNLVSQQLLFQANLLNYMKGSEIPPLPTANQQTVIAMPGSNVQVNTIAPAEEPEYGIGIAEANVEKVLKLRQIEQLRAEIRNLEKVQ